MRNLHWKSIFRRPSIAQIEKQASSYKPLVRTLRVWDLTAFGVAAIVGAGIFSTIGNAAHDGGPAVVLLFFFTAIACGFSALCYAEFASRVPVSGSAYTYAYVAFGEIFAWIIGWDLLMEYAISNIAVAISWSDYFTGLMAGYGLHVPSYFTMDYLSAGRGYDQVQHLLRNGSNLTEIAAINGTQALLKGYHAWLGAPQIFDFRIICNLPALGVTFLVTCVAYFGIQESKITSNIFVLLKILVILLVIVLGAFYVHPSNWTPFAPHGVSGVLKGVSAVFFAYIGFDAISTTAEECEDPQRDLPRAMIYSLGICTLLYVLMSLVLTGMVRSEHLAVGDPLAYVFGTNGANIPWVSGIIAISAVISLFTVLLVYQIGQPRIWMAMSRDGLLPPVFSTIHPRFKTPSFSTVLTGVFVAVPSLFMNLTEVTNLASIGTLFAFALVCGGVLTMDKDIRLNSKSFKMPYVNAKYLFPILALLAVMGTGVFNADGFSYFSRNIPTLVYSCFIIFLSVYCFVKESSLIPALGLATCTFLITELGLTNWIRFGIWLMIGLSIYFMYGFWNSKLHSSE